MAMERPNTWCPETLIIPAKKANFYEKLAQREGGATHANIKDTFAEVMRAELPDGALETKDDIYHRSQYGKQVLRDFLAANPPLEGDEKMAVVCHS